MGWKREMGRRKRGWDGRERWEGEREDGKERMEERERKRKREGERMRGWKGESVCVCACVIETERGWQ